MAIEESKVNQIQVVDYRAAKDAREAFEKFKASVLTKDDFYELKGKKYVRKSGWMMYAMALGITTHIYNERSETVKFKGMEVLVYHFEAKAVSSNGRSSEAVGSASSDEGKPWCDAIHSIRAMAQTRATERAISNLIGGGEVGADELDTKSVVAEYQVRDVQPSSSPPIHNASDEVSLDQDVRDALESAGLDPDGVEVVVRDWGRCVVKPNWPKSGDKDADTALWRRYSDALKGLGAKYHGKDEVDAEIRYNWTVGF